LETVVDPLAVVAPRLVNVRISLVFVDVAAADNVSDVGGDPVVLVTYALLGIPVPVTVMPTTMLLRLVVLPLRLLTVVLPLVVLPARLKVTDLLVCVAVALADNVTVVPAIDETVVGVDVGIPLLLLVTTIPATIPLALVTVNVLLPLVQLPVVVKVVGSV
jgi:hypothetical protein